MTQKEELTHVIYWKMLLLESVFQRTPNQVKTGKSIMMSQIVVETYLPETKGV